MGQIKIGKPYAEIIKECLSSVEDRKGLSLPALKSWIKATYNRDADSSILNKMLKKLAEAKTITKHKGHFLMTKTQKENPKAKKKKAKAAEKKKTKATKKKTKTAKKKTTKKKTTVKKSKQTGAKAKKTANKPKKKKKKKKTLKKKKKKKKKKS